MLFLALGTFVVGTDAFVVAGLLPDLSARLGVDAVAVGQLITAFAVTYAVASPVLGAMTGTWERRKVLLVSLAVFTVGNVLAALATGYTMMVVARIVAAAGAAMFTPAAATTGAMLAAPEQRARALAQVSFGLTIATIIGVPAATLLGTAVGFRGTFVAISIAAVVVMLVIRLVLPAIPSPGGATLRQRIDVTRIPGVVPTLLVSAAAFIGGFTVYNYISPLFTDRLGISPGSITFMLLTFGVGGAVGNLLGGELCDRIGAFRTVVLGLVLAIVGLAVIPLAGSTWAGAVVGVFVWGVGGWMQVPAQQARLISLAGAAGPVAVSLNASAMYLGIGIAGVLGAFVISLLGLVALAWFGAALGVVGLLITLAFYRRTAAPAAAGAQTGTSR